MSEGFIHSVKVPRLYKTVAKIVQNVQENGASLKQLIYEQKHTNVQGVYALAFNTVRHGDQLNQLIRKTQILFKEQRLDPWLTRVLITELIWGKQCLKSESKPIQTVISYEKELREEMKNITEDVDLSKKVEKPRYVRVNTLAMSVNNAIINFQEEGWNFQSGFDNYSSFLKIISNLNKETFVQDFHIPELLIFPHGTAFFNHPGYKSGRIILQDKASCFPAFLLNPPIGSTVLDMCSAPGMKSTHLAAILQNKGKIFSVEMDERRFKTLCDFIELTNSTCVETINKDALTVDSKQCPNIEYILVDPSCSGSGMVDREKVSGKIEKCAPGRLRSLQSFQVLLLRHALLNFPSAKKIIYSTCSIQPEENEHVIDEILTDIGDAYKLVSPKNVLNENWLNFSSLNYNCKDNCLYARPDVDLTNGFFVAVFERNFDVPLPEYKRRLKVKNNKNTENNFNEKNDDNRENEMEVAENKCEKIDETSMESKEWKLTASQKKRMRRRKKFNQQNSKEENILQEDNSNSELKSNELEDNSKINLILNEELEEKKKKKKNKKNETENCSEENEFKEKPKKNKKSNISKEIDNISQEEDSQSKKMKKKKRKLEENSLSIKTESEEISKSSEKEKSKKTKKSKIEEHLSDNEVLSQEEVTDKKNKKRKHNEDTNNSINENDDLSTKKKKKKKKKKETNDC